MTTRRHTAREQYRADLQMITDLDVAATPAEAEAALLETPQFAEGTDDWLAEQAEETARLARRGELAPVPLALYQSRQAAAQLRVQRTVAGSWPWPDVERTVGPLAAGTLTLLGGLTGNGKSTLLANWMNALWSSGVGVYVMPTEERAEDYRIRLATYFLGINFEAVMMERWDEVGVPREQYERDVTEALGFLAKYPELAVSSIPRPTAAQVVSEVKRAAQDFGADLFVLDHFHRVRIEHRDYRLGCADLAQQLKHAALKYNIGIVAACQLNRPSATDRLDRYLPPTVDRIRESSAIGEEADLILMVSRALRNDADPKVMRLVKQGMAQPADIALPNTMQVTCRKHRRWGAQVDKHCYLAVQGGKVKPWEHIPRLALVNPDRKIVGGND